MYRMAENNAKIKFTEVSLTAFISHCYSIVDIYFGHAFRIFTFFNEKHENLFITRATETSLISEINFSMFLISGSNRWEHYQVAAKLSQIDAVPGGHVIAYLRYSFFILSGSTSISDGRSLVKFLGNTSLSSHAIWLKLDLVVRTFKNEVKLSLFYLATFFCRS